MNKTNFLVTIVFDEDSDIKKQTNTEFSLKNKIVKELQYLVKGKEIKHFIVADDEVINNKLKQEPILDKIEEEINSPNRGTCDYFIVDRIEEIINEYKAESEE